MKLAEHVDHIRALIYGAFNNQFSRLGVGPAKMMDADRLPTHLQSKREKIEVLIKNHTDETGSYEGAREKALDELTFTLFNRLAAIKVMEAHQLFPPVVTKEAEHGDRSFGHKVWLQQNPAMRNEELEGIRNYLKYEFNQLGESIPLYHKDYPYALLPFVIEINEIVDAFNEVAKDKQVEDNIWQSDDILGWLYESYNNVKKQAHKDSGEKTEYHKVSLQSQVYTPRWVVEFLVNNSLGKMYLEMYPNSEIKNRYKIANALIERVREPKPLHKIKLIDPATGSGNFVLYGFSFFYALYLDQIENYGADYDVDDIPQLIIENNLHGIDLDDRAIQLAQLGLWIKARQKRRNIGKLKFNLVSSDFFLPDFEFVYPIFKEGIKDTNQLKIVREIWADLQQAHKFGSLVKIEEKLSIRLHGIVEQSGYTLFGQQEVEEYERFKTTFFKNLEDAVTRFASQQGNSFLTDKTHDAITFLKLITQKYDVATANPPYTDSADFGNELKLFIEANYKIPEKFHTNLYATFIKRCFELTNEDGKVAMIHPDTFMFIKTFEDVRTFILENSHINAFAHYPQTGGVFGIGVIYPAFYTLEKGDKIEKDSTFIDVSNINEGRKNEIKNFENRLSASIEDIDNPYVFKLPQSKFTMIKSNPFIYWISNEFREKFKHASIKDILKNCQGLATTNNNRFLRFWWEVDGNDISTNYKIDKKNWVLYAKGGPYKKWSGNIWLVVNWKDEGYDIKEFVKEKYRKTSYAKDFTKERWDKLIKQWVVKNEIFYFQKGISYSAAGAKGASYRTHPSNHIFDVGGSCIFPIKEYKNIEYVIAFLNSKLSSYILFCLNPTVNVQVGDIERIPFVIPPKNLENDIEKLSKTNIEIINHLDSFRIIERHFKRSMFESFKSPDWKSKLTSFLNYENHLMSQILINEAIINEKIFEVYNSMSFS